MHTFLYRKAITIFLALLYTILLLSCQNSNYDTLVKINDFIENHFSNDLDSIKFITIIPEQGCGTCITAAENFYNDFSHRNDMVFIFCNIMSNKLLQNRVNINPANTILDYDNNFLNLLPQNKRIYPCILIINCGKVSAIVWQSKKEHAFMTVRKFLTP